MARVAYLDTSAFVKLVVREPESEALHAALVHWPVRVAAALVRTETIRALARSGNDRYVGRARRLLETVHTIRLDEPLLDRAGGLDPPQMRSLEAIHLAAALSIRPDVGVIFAYDARLSEAARARASTSAAPGSPAATP